MRNLNAFLKLCLLRNGKTISQMADQINLDKAYLSRVFNNHYQVRKERNIKKICNYLGIDDAILFSPNYEFERLCEKFELAFYFCSKQEDEYYSQLQKYQDFFKYTSPYYIDILILTAMYEIEKYKQIPKNISYLIKLYPSLSQHNQEILRTYLILLEVVCPDFSSEYKESHLFKESLCLPPNDKHLLGRYYYFSMSFFRKHNMKKRVYFCYSHANEIFKQTENYMMLENLHIKFSGLLRSYGQMSNAINNDLKLLDEFKDKPYQLKNLEILYNNIAWTYLLIHDYKNAIKYYLKTLEYTQDNEIFFNLAFAYFQIGDKKEANHYVNLGKTAKSYGEYVYIMLEWLEAMINRKYSKKAFRLLLKLKNFYADALDKTVKDMIQIEIVNYLYFSNQYCEALKACAPLVGRVLQTPNQLFYHPTINKSKSHTF